MTWSFVIEGQPRTKKNSRRHERRGKHLVVLPSEAHDHWAQFAMLQLKQQWAGRAPVGAQIEVCAQFYRGTNDPGDLVGYEQALGDVLEVPTAKQMQARKLPFKAGIIVNDRQIVSWDGSRLCVDRERPRIEFTVRVMAADEIPAVPPLGRKGSKASLQRDLL